VLFLNRKGPYTLENSFVETSTSELLRNDSRWTCRTFKLERHKGKPIEIVEEFDYLGRLVTKDDKDGP
jgi:hypothetical protein